MARNPRTSRRWTLLVVADNGRVVPIRHAKGLLTLLIVLLAGTALVAAGAVWCYRLKEERGVRLRAALGELRSQIDNLQQERDLLMARLAMAQTRLREAAADQAPPAETEAGPAPESPAAEAPAAPEGAAAAGVETPAAGQRAVTVEDFRLSREADSDKLRVQFKLINVAEGEEPVSGHTFVVLKNPDLPESRWLSLPRAPLTDGRPADPGRGRYFAIARFNTVRFPAGGERQLGRLNRATVFVFDEDGALLLEKEFPVELPSD